MKTELACEIAFPLRRDFEYTSEETAITLGSGVWKAGEYTDHNGSGVLDAGEYTRLDGSGESRPVKEELACGMRNSPARCMSPFVMTSNTPQRKRR